jgi:hypothetical protein
MRRRRFKSWRLKKRGGASDPGSGDGSSEDLPGSDSESNQPSLFTGYSVVNEADFEAQRKEIWKSGAELQTLISIKHKHCPLTRRFA